MLLPAEILSAVSANGGGKLALVLGAGCSVENPTGLGPASAWSQDLHGRLIADGIIQPGDCVNPNDLSSLADAVFDRTGSQRTLVQRLRDDYNLKLASPNEGHYLAAALLVEGAFSSIVTLNYDLALSTALAATGADDAVGIVESPTELTNQKSANLYYLHRSANEVDPERWILRTVVLQEAWKGGWEALITTRVLTAPVVVFVGLGTPVSVLIESVKLIRAAAPGATCIFQVDVIDSDQSQTFKALALDKGAYVKTGWCEFMRALSGRAAIAQIARVRHAIKHKVADEGLQEEELETVLSHLEQVGVWTLGELRASWCLHPKRYCKDSPDASGWLADLLLALGLMARLSGATLQIRDNAVVEFVRHGRVVAAVGIASGRGHRSISAIEAELTTGWRGRPRSSVPLVAAIVAGTSDFPHAPTPPVDLIRGDEDSILSGPTRLELVHVSALRKTPVLAQRLVP